MKRTDVPETVTDEQKADLERRANSVPANRDWFSRQAVDKRIAGNLQHDRRHES